jgi:hypothetical protein
LEDFLMPNRILREGILDSARMEALVRDAGWQAECFYRRLISVVDDFGCFDGRPSVLRARCFPTLLELVREADVSRWIAACVKSGLIVLYTVDGRNYVEVSDFRQFTRAKQRKFPPPPDGMQRRCNADATQMNSGCAPNADTDTDTDTEALVCSEPLIAASLPPPVLQFPVNRRKGQPELWDLEQDYFDELLSTFSGLDVLAECKKALLWLAANPNRKKTARGMKTFLFGWMSRCGNRGGSNGKPAAPSDDSTGFVRAQDTDETLDALIDGRPVQ